MTSSTAWDESLEMVTMNYVDGYKINHQTNYLNY